eukprot:9466890-Pyramimonas_sp.AAC.1
MLGKATLVQDMLGGTTTRTNPGKATVLQWPSVAVLSPPHLPIPCSGAPSLPPTPSPDHARGQEHHGDLERAGAGADRQSPTMSTARMGKDTIWPNLSPQVPRLLDTHDLPLHSVGIAGVPSMQIESVSPRVSRQCSNIHNSF